MIRTVERKYFRATGMDARHANRIFYCISTTVGEEDFVQMITRAFRDALGRFAAGFVCMLRRNSGEQSCLILDGCNNLGMLETDIRENQLGREVEEAITVVIPEVGALPTSYWQWRDSALG